MVTRRKRGWMAAGLLGLLGALCAAFFLFRAPADLREFFAVSQEWSAAGQLSAAESDRYAQRTLAVAQKYPGTVGALSALLFVATNAPDTDLGKEARRKLATQIESADMNVLADAFGRGVMGNWRPLSELGAAVSGPAPDEIPIIRGPLGFLPPRQS